MPDIAYATTPADGDTIDATEVWQRFVNTTPEAGLTVINGSLDQDNIAAALTINREHVQPGALVDGWSAAGNANLDWRWSWFGSFDNTLDGTADEDAGAHGSAAAAPSAIPGIARPIPGGGRRFWLRRACRVLVTWQVMWTNSSHSDESSERRLSTIFFTVDGDSYQTAQRRSVGQTATGAFPAEHEGYKKNRYWHGHMLLDLQRGYHDVQLYIAAHKDIPNTRVWARGMRVLAFTFPVV